MKQYNQQRKYKSRIKPYDIEITVDYVPFPSEKARKEAYRSHAKLFLKAKERMFKKSYRKAEHNSNSSNKKGEIETALSSY